MDYFQLIPPEPSLTAYVKRYWVLETDRPFDTPERIIPFGNIQLSFYSGAPIRNAGGSREPRSLLCGQTTGYTDIFPTGKLRIIAVVFQPVGARAFFHLPLNELTDLKITAEELSDRGIKELEERIADTEDRMECIRQIEKFLMGRLCLFQDYNILRLSKAIEVINRCKGEISITTLADHSCLSPKQFRRIFSSHVGINPKDFLRIIRFQFALYILQKTPCIHFSQLAYECGYYDQAHLIHEFKALSGYTPGEYLNVGPPYSDYFS